MQSFRTWLRELWLENCSEHDVYNEPRYTMGEYFIKYKWWLKREYTHQKNVEKKTRSDYERGINRESRI